MMPFVMTRRALLTALALLATLLPGHAAVAQDRATVSSGPLTDPARVLDFWTERRMESAKPLMPRFPGGVATRQSLRQVETEGEPGSYPATGPAERSTFRSAGATTTSSSEAGDYPFTRTEVATPGTAPYRAAGKIFFTDPSDGQRYVCSGTVVNTENKSVVFTAGHCLFWAGMWMTNWIFVPGYDDGNAPYGQWPASSLRVSAQWATSASPRYDFGAALIRPNSQGQRVADVVGGRGIAWNYDVQQNFDAFGYPAGPPFDGGDMFVCEAATGLTDNFMAGAGPDPVGIGCDMTAGASGGGWIIQDQYLNTVVSYGYDNLPEVLFGPYFGDAAEVLFEVVRNADPGGEQPPPPDDDTRPVFDDVVDTPDPFSPNGDRRKDKTKILFTLSESSWVGLWIHNRSGKLVRTINENVFTTPGRWYTFWNGKTNGGRPAKNGRYRYRLRAEDAAGNVGTATGIVTVRR